MSCNDVDTKQAKVQDKLEQTEKKLRESEAQLMKINKELSLQKKNEELEAKIQETEKNLRDSEREKEEKTVKWKEAVKELEELKFFNSLLFQTAMIVVGLLLIFWVFRNRRRIFSFNKK